jgi:inorganic pyrophosphatase
MLREIEHFFSVYKELEGKHTEIKGWRNAAHAQGLIASSHKQFKANSAGSTG